MMVFDLIDLNISDLVFYNPKGITVDDRYKLIDIEYPLDDLSKNLYVIVNQSKISKRVTLLGLYDYLNLFKNFNSGIDVDDIILKFGKFDINQENYLKIEEEIDIFEEIGCNFNKCIKMLNGINGPNTENESYDIEQARNKLLEQRMDSFKNLINNYIEKVRINLLVGKTKENYTEWVGDILFNKNVGSDYVRKIKEWIFKVSLN